MVTNPNLLDFVTDPVAITRLDDAEARRTFTLFDPVLQTRLVLREAHWSVADCLAEARRHASHLGCSLVCMFCAMRSLDSQRRRLPLHPCSARRELKLCLWMCGLWDWASVLSLRRFLLFLSPLPTLLVPPAIWRVCTSAWLDVSGQQVPPFQSLDFYVDFLSFRPHTGLARPPVTPRQVSARAHEVLEDISDVIEDAFDRDDHLAVLHLPGSPPFGISFDRLWEETQLLFAVSDALALAVPHYDIAVHFPGAIPRGTDGVLHLLLDVDRSLGEGRTFFLIDGRPLQPAGPPFRVVSASCSLHMGKLFGLVRDAFPRALLPAHLRVNGRLLTTLRLLRYYCPLVRALPALPPEEDASLEFLDSSAFPVEEVVRCFPGLSLDLQQARAAETLTTSTTTAGVPFVMARTSTTTTTSPGFDRGACDRLPVVTFISGAGGGRPVMVTSSGTCSLCEVMARHARALYFVKMLPTVAVFYTSQRLYHVPGRGLCVFQATGNDRQSGFPIWVISPQWHEPILILLPMFVQFTLDVLAKIRWSGPPPAFVTVDGLLWDGTPGRFYTISVIQIGASLRDLQTRSLLDLRLRLYDPQALHFLTHGPVLEALEGMSPARVLL